MFALKPHSTSQTADNSRGEILCLGRAVDLRSDLFSFLKSHQAHFKSDVGSYTLSVDVSIPGLGGPGLRGELPLDPLFFHLTSVGEEELPEDELEKERGSPPDVMSSLDLLPFL